ncbi:expansin-like B1 [Coffea arabica]|uniref:Expansin-like B1 n=1 Tax=Coffea arabica TaxID=13443 RepID=A0A6P6TY35_COFAR|nr:expansin-like B1 [Coffea arabica]
MGFMNSYCVAFLCIIVLLPALCHGGDYYSSRATYYGSPDCLGTPTGACGFGEYGRTVNDGQVSGVSSLYRGGSGCGACYQVRCTIPEHCTEEGTKVVVTDYGEGDKTDFVLSTAAYGRLARPYMAEHLFAYGVVDVEFKRIPCKYSYNLLFLVQAHSRYPGYLALVPLYQPGAYDITAIEVWQEDCKQWRPMRRPSGAVFDMTDPPLGALTLRFQGTVYGYGDSNFWVQLTNVIPSEWKAGYTYDTGISA